MPNYSIFELFLDLPHPASSSGCPPAKIVQPPEPTKDVVELSLPESISRIARFAFPEHDDYLHEATSASQRSFAGTRSQRSMRSHQSQSQHSFHRSEPNNMNNNNNEGAVVGGGLNVHDIYLHSFYALYYTFILQLSSGTLIHGHVRRYFPHHPDAPTRYDVGRRGYRVLVLMTRAPGGERFFSSVLKTAEAVSTRHTAMSPINPDNENVDPTKTFLYTLQTNYHKMFDDYRRLHHGGENYNHPPPNFGSSNDSLGEHIPYIFLPDDRFSKLQVEGVEYGPRSPLISLDRVQFYLPPSLQPDYNGKSFTVEDIHNPILPLCRCLGAAHTMRLLSGLLCERRIILVSQCPCRLSACVRAAASLLAQGLLVWQHLFVPILPPHLFQYLKTKSSYLIGVLDKYTRNLETLPGIGGVLAVKLDTNEMVTFNVNNPSEWIPDMLAQPRKTKSQKCSCPELLAQDIDDILKADRRVWVGDCFGTIQAPAIGGAGYRTEDSKKNFFANMGRSFIRKKPIEDQHSTHSPNEFTAYPTEEPTESPNLQDISYECCENEKAEEALRVALTAFYLYIIGDMGMFLSETSSGKLLLDVNKFYRCKIIQGVPKDSTLFYVIVVFARTALFEKFVRDRIAELAQPTTILQSQGTGGNPLNSCNSSASSTSYMNNPEQEKLSLLQQKSLFSMCESFMRRNAYECTLSNIRKIVQQHSQLCPNSDIAHNTNVIRDKVLSLTSNQNFEGDSVKALASLIDSSLEVNGSLCQIMSVIWIRMKEKRSTLWRHPLLALYVIRNFLLHGPITAIVESSDGMNLIRKLTNYVAIRNPGSGNLIKEVSSDIYNLLTRRTYLFLQRSHLACRRLNISVVTPEPRWSDYLIRRLPTSVPFESIHGLFRPKHVASIEDDDGIQPFARRRFVTEYDDGDDHHNNGNDNNNHNNHNEHMYDQDPIPLPDSASSRPHEKDYPDDTHYYPEEINVHTDPEQLHDHDHEQLHDHEDDHYNEQSLDQSAAALLSRKRHRRQMSEAEYRIVNEVDASRKAQHADNEALREAQDDSEIVKLVHLFNNNVSSRSNECPDDVNEPHSLPQQQQQQQQKQQLQQQQTASNSGPNGTKTTNNPPYLRHLNDAEEDFSSFDTQSNASFQYTQPKTSSQSQSQSQTKSQSQSQSQPRRHQSPQPQSQHKPQQESQHQSLPVTIWNKEETFDGPQYVSENYANNDPQPQTRTKPPRSQPTSQPNHGVPVTNGRKKEPTFDGPQYVSENYANNDPQPQSKTQSQQPKSTQSAPGTNGWKKEPTFDGPQYVSGDYGINEEYDHDTPQRQNNSESMYSKDNNNDGQYSHESLNSQHYSRRKSQESLYTISTENEIHEPLHHSSNGNGSNNNNNDDDNDDDDTTLPTDIKTFPSESLYINSIPPPTSFRQVPGENTFNTTGHTAFYHKTS